MPLLFAVTLFVSAALLFWVQPLVAKLLVGQPELRQSTLRLWGTPESELAATLRAHDAEAGIVTEDWSPLASGKQVMADETIRAIADEVGATPAQVILRWHLQLGSVVIPKSVTPSRIEENFGSLGIELTQDQMERIGDLDRGMRTGPDPDEFAVGAVTD